MIPVDAGDYVVVSNALQVRLTGKKGTDKTYFHHSGFMSGLKEVPITRMRERNPEEVRPISVGPPQFGWTDAV
jgi:large subunit ribosomal protein L13